MEFDKIENRDIFKVDEFDYLLDFQGIKLFKTDKLFLSRLSNAYKSRIAQTTDQMNQTIYEAYRNSFIAWEENLVNIVRTNIVDYSPELKAQQKHIDEETVRIHDLQNSQCRLKIYADDIFSMIDWKKD